MSIDRVRPCGSALGLGSRFAWLPRLSWWTVVIGLLRGSVGYPGQAIEYDLREFLPYTLNSSSSLVGGAAFRFFSTRASEFDWDLRTGTPQRRVIGCESTGLFESADDGWPGVTGSVSSGRSLPSAGGVSSRRRTIRRRRRGAGVGRRGWRR